MLSPDNDLILDTPQLKSTNSENPPMKQNTLVIAELKILAPWIENVTHATSFTKQHEEDTTSSSHTWIFATQNLNHDIGTTLALSKMNDIKTQLSLANIYGT